MAHDLDTSAEEIAAGLRAGACDCISKPFTAEELVARVERAIASAPAR